MQLTFHFVRALVARMLNMPNDYFYRSCRPRHIKVLDSLPPATVQNGLSSGDSCGLLPPVMHDVDERLNRIRRVGAG